MTNKKHIEKLEIHGDSAILLTKGMDYLEVESLAKKALKIWPDKSIYFIVDPHGRKSVEQLDESEMNAAGWYRK